MKLTVRKLSLSSRSRLLPDIQDDDTERRACTRKREVLYLPQLILSAESGAAPTFFVSRGISRQTVGRWLSL